MSSAEGNCYDKVVCPFVRSRVSCSKKVAACSQTFLVCCTDRTARDTLCALKELQFSVFTWRVSPTLVSAGVFGPVVFVALWTNYFWFTMHVLKPPFLVHPTRREEERFAALTHTCFLRDNARPCCAT